MKLKDILEGNQKVETQLIKTSPATTTTTAPRTPKYKKYYEFIDDYYDILIKALYNARNTIRGKKEVKEGDKSKQYYRDFLKYEEVIKKLEEMI